MDLNDQQIEVIKLLTEIDRKAKKNEIDYIIYKDIIFPIPYNVIEQYGLINGQEISITVFCVLYNQVKEVREHLHKIKDLCEDLNRYNFIKDVQPKDFLKENEKSKKKEK